MKKLPKRQFFTWKEYRDINLIVPGGISIINGGRDIGKTTGTFLEWLELASQDEMIMYIRNTEKELKAYAKSFNAQYNGRFYMTSTTIFKLEKVPLYRKDKITKEEIFERYEYKRDMVIGYCATLNGTDGWRSANFNNVKYIFSDEYNQIGNSLNFEKFITLWTSILRTKQNVYTVLIGNRDDAAADILVELGVEIVIPENYEGDWIVPLLPDDENFSNKCFFIDLDDSRFNNNQVPTVWKALGRTSEKLGKYFDRGYKTYENIDCRRLKPETMKKVKWDWSYTTAFHPKIIVGTLGDIVVVHIDKFEEYSTRLKFSDSFSTYTNKNFDNITHNYSYCFFMITNAAQDDSIIYTSILAKEEITKLMMEFADNIDENVIKM